MEIQHALLGLIQLSPNYGYQLGRLYNQFFSFNQSVHLGQIYSSLSRLERDGKIISIKSSEDSDGPERVKYQITKSGSAALNSWLSSPEDLNLRTRMVLYIKTILALIHEQRADQLLDLQRQEYIAKMRELNQSRRTADLPEKLIIDYHIYHLEADLRWIDLTESRLKSLKKEIAKCQA